MDNEEFLAALEAALIPCSNVGIVQMETPEGLEMLFYAPAGDDRYADGGTLLFPADTLENRRRRSITMHCPLCPDVNQGLATRDVDLLGPDAGLFALAAYNDCGHEAAVQLGGEGILLVFTEGVVLSFPPPEH